MVLGSDKEQKPGEEFYPGGEKKEERSLLFKLCCRKKID